MKLVKFTPEEIWSIKNDYLINGMSASKIAKKYDISQTPIKRILKEHGILKKGYSDGKKKDITEDQYNMIKNMYLNEFKNIKYISEKLNLNYHLIEKIINNSGYRRGLSEAMSILKTGKKLKDSVKHNMKIAQQKISKSGLRKQTGGVCKKFNICGLECHGTYEKYYIEKLIREKNDLPTNANPINTPFGTYYPDFSFDNKIVEIKCDYTYDVLIGLKISRFTKKKETLQYEKIKWVNSNIIPIDILVIDKRNDKIIKKEII